MTNFVGNIQRYGTIPIEIARARATLHDEQDVPGHREKWNNWFTKYAKAGNLAGGNALSLYGKMIKG